MIPHCASMVVISTLCVFWEVMNILMRSESWRILKSWKRKMRRNFWKSDSAHSSMNFFGDQCWFSPDKWPLFTVQIIALINMNNRLKSAWNPVIIISWGCEGNWVGRLWRENEISCVGNVRIFLLKNDTKLGGVLMYNTTSQPKVSDTENCNFILSGAKVEKLTTWIFREKLKSKQILQIL